MTNLSITDRLLQLEAREELSSFTPLAEGTFEGRRWLWLTQKAKAACDPETNTNKKIKARSLANLNVQMGKFVRGEFVEYDINVKRLENEEDEVWTMKTVRVKPQLRLFGWFPQPKHFVGVHLALRDDLGEEGSPQWNAGIEKVMTARAGLFPGYPLFRAEDFENYV